MVHVFCLLNSTLYYYHFGNFIVISVIMVMVVILLSLSLLSSLSLSFPGIIGMQSAKAT